MKPKKFSNQSAQQILKHLGNSLQDNVSYDLKIDPIGIRFLITETIWRRKIQSKKRKKLKVEQESMSKKQRRISNTKKRIRPKIRSVKKGRVVKLKGRV